MKPNGFPTATTGSPIRSETGVTQVSGRCIQAGAVSTAVANRSDDRYPSLYALPFPRLNFQNLRPSDMRVVITRSPSSTTPDPLPTSRPLPLANKNGRPAKRLYHSSQRDIPTCHSPSFAFLVEWLSPIPGTGIGNANFPHGSTPLRKFCPMASPLNISCNSSGLPAGCLSKDKRISPSLQSRICG